MSLANICRPGQTCGVSAGERRITPWGLAEDWLCLPNIFRMIHTVNEDMKQDWARLGRVIKARREYLGLSQARVRELDGPSQPVQTQVENNDATKPRPRSDSLHKFDKPLQWMGGSTLTTLRGGDPTPIGSTKSIRELADGDLIEELTRRLEELRHALENTETPGTSPEAGQAQEEKLPDDAQGDGLSELDFRFSETGLGVDDADHGAKGAG